MALVYLFISTVLPVTPLSEKEVQKLYLGRTFSNDISMQHLATNSTF